MKQEFAIKILADTNPCFTIEITETLFATYKNGQLTTPTETILCKSLDDALIELVHRKARNVELGVITGNEFVTIRFNGADVAKFDGEYCIFMGRLSGNDVTYVTDLQHALQIVGDLLRY